MKKFIFIFMLLSIMSKAQRITLPNQCSWSIRAYCVTLDSIQIQNSNSNPIDVGIPTPGQNETIDIVSACIQYNAGTTLFNTGYLRIFTQGATDFQASSYIGSTTSFYRKMEVNENGNSTLTQLMPNKKIFVVGDSDSPVGDGSVTIFIFYVFLQ